MSRDGGSLPEGVSSLRDAPVTLYSTRVLLPLTHLLLPLLPSELPGCRPLGQLGLGGALSVLHRRTLRWQLRTGDEAVWVATQCSFY